MELLVPVTLIRPFTRRNDGAAVDIDAIGVGGTGLLVAVPAIVTVPPPVVLTALPASRTTPWLPPTLAGKAAGRAGERDVAGAGRRDRRAAVEADLQVAAAAAGPGERDAAGPGVGDGGALDDSDVVDAARIAAGAGDRDRPARARQRLLNIDAVVAVVGADAAGASPPVPVMVMAPPPVDWMPPATSQVTP